MAKSDANGWKRGCGPYSMSYPKIKDLGNPDSKVDRSGEIDRASANGGFAAALPKAKKNKDGAVY